MRGCGAVYSLFLWLLAIFNLHLLSGCGNNASFEATSPKKAAINSQDATPTPTPKEEPQPEPVPEPQPEPKPVITEKQVEQRLFLEQKNTAIDLVMAVDTSGSMKGEKELLEANLAGFIADVKASNLKDFRFFVIGEDFTFDISLLKDLKVISEKVGSNDALSVLSEFFEETLPLIDSPPVEDTHLEIVVITDDDGKGKGNTAEDFMVPAGYKKMRFNGIIGLVKGKDPFNPDCDIKRPGLEYLDLAMQTDGLAMNLCDSDWKTLLRDLKDNIVAFEGAEIMLDQTPIKEKGIIVVSNNTEFLLGESSITDVPSVILEKDLAIDPYQEIILKYWVKVQPDDI